ncbi:hypothetical protein WA588_004330 [Blastocystis sp. NMH]
MQSPSSDEVCLSMIQRELAVLNQKVTKLGTINSFFMKMQTEGKEGRSSDRSSSISISIDTLNSLLIVLWTLTGERRNMKEVAGLGDVILEQVPVLIQTIFEQLAIRLHKRLLSTCELTILQSTAGVMGNLSSVPEGVVGVRVRCEETVLTRYETILIHINTILKNGSILNNQQTLDILLWCLENYAYSQEGREKLLQLQVWRVLCVSLFRPFLQHELSLSEQGFLSILSIFKSVASISPESKTRYAAAFQQYATSLLSTRGRIDFADPLISRSSASLQELFSLLSSVASKQTKP